MKFNAILPNVNWVDNGGRYLIHPLTSALRLDSESIISNKSVLVNFREDFGKTDDSKYVKGLRIKTMNYDSDYQDSELIFEQYKAVIPYSYKAKFAYHLPIRQNIWLMIAIK
jgi:hypothetical protein